MNRSVILLLLIFLNIKGYTQSATEKASHELYNKIGYLDSSLYAAYNSQDLPGFMKYLSKDLEWYKDISGILNYDTVYHNFQQIFSNKIRSERKLVRSSFRVYPIRNYGAMEMGSHKVTYMLHGKLMSGIFKFIMIWKEEKGEWLIKRVISYGHKID